MQEESPSNLASVKQDNKEGPSQHMSSPGPPLSLQLLSTFLCHIQLPSLPPGLNLEETTSKNPLQGELHQKPCSADSDGESFPRNLTWNTFHPPIQKFFA